MKAGQQLPALPLVQVRVQLPAHRSFASDQPSNLLSGRATQRPDTIKTREVLQRKLGEAGILDLRHSDCSLHGLLNSIHSRKAINYLK